MKNILYVGPRGLSDDPTGSAWNNKRDSLCLAFKYLQVNADYLSFDSSQSNKRLYRSTIFILIALYMILTRGIVSIQEMVFIYRFVFSKALESLYQRAIVGVAPDVILLESSRVSFLLPLIRLFPRIANAPIVCDMDDLLSDRYRQWASSSEPLSIGFLDSNTKLSMFVPIIGLFKRLVCTYEYHGLKFSEQRLVKNCSKVLLVSQREASLLAFQNPVFKNKILATSVCDASTPYPKVELYERVFSRFVFIGSDRQPQNRSAINNLLRLWSELDVAFPLYIYGKMYKEYVHHSNVSFMGYAPDLSSVFSECSVLLNPTLILGGIKIKTVQAIVRGTPVFGLPAAFEGLPKSTDLFSVTSLPELSSIICSADINQIANKQAVHQAKTCLPLLNLTHFANNYRMAFA